ncbi:unnamed protein product [Echinostoma caproni]|uniref:Pectinesterase n=1 Tax=Echinostoma caproni TaxID=27848 RepID=A0A183B6T0_9TREM|nr:unnamed protein product [Echinostoma caproni]
MKCEKMSEDLGGEDAASAVPSVLMFGLNYVALEMECAQLELESSEAIKRATNAKRYAAAALRADTYLQCTQSYVCDNTTARFVNWNGSVNSADGEIVNFDYVNINFFVEPGFLKHYDSNLRIFMSPYQIYYFYRVAKQGAHISTDDCWNADV